MKRVKIICAAAVLFAVSCVLTSCSKDSVAEMSNEMKFELDGIESIVISYDDEDITFIDGNGDSLVVKEYMSKNKARYHADVREKDGEIHISEGGKPLFKGDFERYVEVYLPDSYTDSLKITTTDGNIDSSNIGIDTKKLRIDTTSGTLKLKKAEAKNIHISTTSGSLELGSLNANQIRLETTDGSVSCDKVRGKMKYTTTGGDAYFNSVIGYGSYRADNSGKLSVTFEKVTGDLYLFNKNDNIELNLPEESAFEFEAETKNGSVKTNFNENLSFKGNTVKGNVGKNPEIKIKTESRNGNIEVKK